MSGDKQTEVHGMKIQGGGVACTLWEGGACCAIDGAWEQSELSVEQSCPCEQGPKHRPL